MLLSKSPAVNLALSSLGINTALDVVNYLPRRYESFLYTPKKLTYEDKERIVKLGHLKQKGRCLRFAKRSLVSFYFETIEGELFLVEAWNRSYLSSSLKSETLYTLSGIYDRKRHSISLVNILVGKIEEENALRPIYNLPSNIPNHSFRHLVKKSYDLVANEIKEEIPSYFKEKYKLLSHKEALLKAHFPKNEEDLRLAKRTLKYEEALSFSTKSALIRKNNKIQKKNDSKINIAELKGFIHSLPYSLLSDQKIALKEILNDMDSSFTMYRLIQGDVGTGKTLVSLLASYANYTRKKQTALLAPTESLAKQHYANFKNLLKNTNVRVSLLIGSLSKEEKNSIYEKIENNEVDIIIGTHALFVDKLDYADLGLAIIDEQHKFGVNQRARLLNKGDNADLLLMSATPIPRTLSLSVYGDLDVSTLTSFPKGKRDVKTLLLKESDPRVSKAIAKSLANNGRVYVVVPQIEGDNESTSVVKMSEIYKSLYPNKVTLMHGKMDEFEKDVAIMSFKSGLTPILVATSLIEVGIDVKEANLMIIYSSSHFSLSSLHQLRGRVGRDGNKAYCFLLYSKSEEKENEKLRILETTNDGFKVAEEDMRLRGPGEMAGTKQSGLPSFNVANIVDDFRMFEESRDNATYMLSHPQNEEFKRYIAKIQKEMKDISLA